MEMEREKKKMERDMVIRNDICGHIYGEIADLKIEAKADRVYIVQPHPLGNESLVSVFFEVKERGVEAMKPHIQQLPLADIPKFYSALTKNDFMAIHNIDNVEDIMAHSIFSTYGASECYIYKMQNARKDWNGSIFVEYTSEKSPFNEAEMQEMMKACAATIHYQLPEYKAV